MLHKNRAIALRFIGFGWVMDMYSTKIYWENPQLQSFEVTVLHCKKIEEHFEITIAEEVARPEGGGQAGDRGSLTCESGEIEFFDTVLRGDKITLLTNKEIPNEKQIPLKLDMKWRKGMMRNHTAEHLLVSSLLRINSDLKLGYIWIDGNHGTVEIIGGPVDLELILQAEKKVQNIIADSELVESRLVDSLDLDVQVRAREGVSKLESFRIISIWGIDHSACSGTHVQNTHEIGMFKVIDYKITKTGARLEFVTADKAVDTVSEIYNLALSRKLDYPFEMQQLGAILDKSKRYSVERQELIDEVKSLINKDTSVETINGVCFRYCYLPSFSSWDLKESLKSMQLEDSSLTLLFSPGIKSNFVIWMNGISEDKTQGLSQVIQDAGGKGGGSRSSFTGGFNDVQNPRRMFEEFVDLLKAWIES